MTAGVDMNGRRHDPLCRGHYQRITDPPTSPDGYQLMHTSDATDTVRRLLQELPK